MSLDFNCIVDNFHYNSIDYFGSDFTLDFNCVVELEKKKIIKVKDIIIIDVSVTQIILIRGYN
jgi:hypothetical protein